MKYILCLFVFIATTYAQKPAADTLIAKSQLLKSVADQGEVMEKEFQYSLTPQQRDLQEKIKQAMTVYSVYKNISQDSIRVPK